MTNTAEEVQARARAAGEDVETDVYEDYFGFQETHRWLFPDGRQWIEYQTMNEGAKAQFQKRTNRDLVVERASGNARMNIDPAQERWALLGAACTSWHIMREGHEVNFSNATFEQWLKVANPRLVEDLEKAVRKANPWLLQDMTVEDIDREIKNLQEMREVAEEREKEKGVSVSR